MTLAPSHRGTPVAFTESSSQSSAVSVIFSASARARRLLDPLASSAVHCSLLRAFLQLWHPDREGRRRNRRPRSWGGQRYLDTISDSKPGRYTKLNLPRSRFERHEFHRRLSPTAFALSARISHDHRSTRSFSSPSLRSKNSSTMLRFERAHAHFHSSFPCQNRTMMPAYRLS